MHNEKFISSFVKFINIHLINTEHKFIILGGKDIDTSPIPNYENVEILDIRLCINSNKQELEKKLYPYFNQAYKVILHGLFEKYYIDFLYKNDNFLNKCLWVIWGGDLYDYQKRGLVSKNFLTLFKKKHIIKKLSGFITYVQGDYELAKKWHGNKDGKYYECFMYTSNLYKEYRIKDKRKNMINIQIGNSADPTNNHFEILKELEKYKDKDIKIIVPLSYGNEFYAKKVITEGQKIFGDKFIGLEKFMSFEQYLDLLSEVDIAIFNHDRQQAMGNIITLLGLGKKVYIKKSITPWRLFNNLDVKVFDINKIDLKRLSHKDKENNTYKIKNYFSEFNYLMQLKKIFES